MNYQLAINEAFFIYDRKMNKIYHELNSLKESYSYDDYKLIKEGFWDKVKDMARQTGAGIGNIKNAATKSVNYITTLGKDVYDKGVELGKKAVEIGKELINKVSSAIDSGIAAIKAAPGQIWDSIVSLSTSVGAEIAEVYKKAKEKGGEWVTAAKDMAVKIYTKMAAGLSSAYEAISTWASNNQEEFKKYLAAKSAELQEAAEASRKSTIEDVKQLGEFISKNAEKIKNGTIEIAKVSSMVILGLIVLPFYATYLMTKKTYEIGEEFVGAMKAGINTLKTNLGETWQAGVEGYKSTQQPSNEGYIIKNFNKFNEELSPETYYSAANKLAFGHPERAKNLNDYADKIPKNLDTKTWDFELRGDVSGHVNAKLSKDRSGKFIFSGIGKIGSYHGLLVISISEFGLSYDDGVTAYVKDRTTARELVKFILDNCKINVSINSLYVDKGGDPGRHFDVVPGKRC